MQPSESSGKSITSAREGQRRRRVLLAARRLFAALGNDYFQSITANLTSVLSVDGAYVAEIPRGHAGRIRTLATVRNYTIGENFEQELAGSAPGQTVADGWYTASREVQRIFPEDPHLREVGAEGYAAVKLSDSSGQPIGVLAVESADPLPDAQLARSVLETFAPRVAFRLERKRIEDLRRENEERYTAFVMRNPDSMWRFEFEQPIPLAQSEDAVIEDMYRYGYLAECNDAAAGFFGLEHAEQLIGARFERFAPRDDLQFREYLRSAVRSGFRGTFAERVFPDGKGGHIHRVRNEFGIVEDNHLLRVWGTTRDITTLRRAELAAAAAERQFREVLECIEIPALILDRNGTIRFHNECLARLLQRSASELNHSTWLDGLIDEKDRLLWVEALGNEEPGDCGSHFECQLIRRDGLRRLVLWDTICLHDPNGRVVAMAAIGRDLTYVRAMEEEVRRSQKLDAVGRLAAGVVHDFNGLLTVVLGNAELLMQGLPESDPTRHRLSEIVQTAHESAKLLQKLLALGRRQPGRPQLIDLNAVIRNLEPVLRVLAGKGVHMGFDMHSNLPHVMADPTQIEQVLLNLVSNARDAMLGGGNLTIATAVRTASKADPRYPGLDAGSYVALSITDTGTGLDDEVRLHLFEPFFTTKGPGSGSGLGLASVYAIVRQLAGHIVVQSAKGEGTSFEVLLPAPPATVQ